MPARICRHFIIRGRVQGVGYRAAALDEARRLGLAGWVRNRLDGSVEALACGTAEAVATFASWAQRGPTASRVEEVALAEAEDPALETFEFRPTA